MKYIDEKFKDNSPERTVEEIATRLKGIGIELIEEWNDSGVENCHSLRVSTGNYGPGTNGKGVTRAFARASGYGEFIERLQSGLFFYKYQSFECDPEVNLQTYAPDGRYFTVEELEKNAEWFDYLTKEYGITRKALAEQCKMYAHTDDGNVLCIPFYSVFEDKYVYMPAGFIEAMYSANGCCVGNTREEALVHALAEIMERRASIDAIANGKSFPEIPDDVLSKFPVVSNILRQIRESDDFHVSIFDCSIGNGFPVVSTRIIDKKNHKYAVNYAADPVLEIAVQRSLTEIFQGRQLKDFGKNRTSEILASADEKRKATNVINQLENGSGSFTVDYCANELTCDREATSFEDNSGLTNKQLLEKMYELYRRLGKPLYIRNCAFLGFPCYKVIVPGFSESRGMRLTESIQEYALGDMVSKILRDPESVSDDDLNIVFMFDSLISGIFSRRNNFAYLAGLPLDSKKSFFIWYVTMAYCAHRIKSADRLKMYLKVLSDGDFFAGEDIQYFSCVDRYLELKHKGVDKEKIYCILKKFYYEKHVDRLKGLLENGKTPFDEYILKCDGRNCSGCRYKEFCGYETARKVIRAAGKVYSEFKDGQSKDNFIIP